MANLVCHATLWTKGLMVYKWLGLITYNLQVGPSEMEWLVG